jgi:hypothetical protein
METRRAHRIQNFARRRRASRILRNAARREARMNKGEGTDLLRVRRNSRLMKGGRRDKNQGKLPTKTSDV